MKIYQVRISPEADELFDDDGVLTTTLFKFERIEAESAVQAATQYMSDDLARYGARIGVEIPFDVHCLKTGTITEVKLRLSAEFIHEKPTSIPIYKCATCSRESMIG